MDGADITRAEPRDRDIAMVFQSYALYPHLSVRDNLAFGLKMRKTPKDEIARRIGEAAEMLGLAPLLERRPAQLSGGQRQRVAMGRAVVRRPRVFLFDEPLSNLDAALRGQMRVELMRLHQRLGATMVYVTHDQVEAMTLADRIAVLNAGALMQVGAPAELYTRPANLFVARFIGTPEMNVIDARAAEACRLTAALPRPVALGGRARRGPAPRRRRRRRAGRRRRAPRRRGARAPARRDDRAHRPRRRACGIGSTAHAASACRWRSIRRGCTASTPTARGWPSRRRTRAALPGR